jgi:hypothetical protein
MRALELLLINSSEVIDGDITLEIDEYDDGDSSYTADSDDEETCTIGNHSYSYKIMCEIVQYANTHQFSTVKNRYRLMK